MDLLLAKNLVGAFVIRSTVSIVSFGSLVQASSALVEQCPVSFKWMFVALAFLLTRSFVELDTQVIVLQYLCGNTTNIGLTRGRSTVEATSSVTV